MWRRGQETGAEQWRPAPSRGWLRRPVDGYAEQRKNRARLAQNVPDFRVATDRHRGGPHGVLRPWRHRSSKPSDRAVASVFGVVGRWRVGLHRLVASAATEAKEAPDEFNLKAVRP